MQTMPGSCEKIKKPVTTCNPLHKYFVMIMFAKSDDHSMDSTMKKSPDLKCSAAMLR